MLKLSLTLILFTFSLVYGQNKKADSLWSIYNNTDQKDTTRIKALNDIARSLLNNSPDSALVLANTSLLLAQKNNQKKLEGTAFTIIGISYKNKNDYPKSLNSYLSALKIFEEIGDKKGTGNCYNNIGLIYKDQSNYTKSLEYHFKAFKIRLEMKDDAGMANCYYNICNVYSKQANYVKALEYGFKALDFFDKINDKSKQAYCYNALGAIYAQQNNLNQALKYFNCSLEIQRAQRNKQAIGLSYTNMGELYKDKSNLNLALSYNDSGLQVAKEIGSIDLQCIAYKNLGSVYAKIGRFKEAYENHVKFKELTDSIFNIENSKQLGDLKTQFEVEKKESELKAKADAQELINVVEKKRQQSIIYSVAGLLVLVMVFAILMFNRFKMTQKQKVIIEEKQKEILDSIHYAKRIQQSLLPTETYIEKQFKKGINQTPS